MSEFYSCTSPPKVKKKPACQWPIATLCLAKNGRDVVFNYLSLPTVIFSLILGFNEIVNQDRCVLVDIFVLPSAKYVTREQPWR